MPLIQPKHVILCVILALGAWALWPPRSGSDKPALGSAAPGAGDAAGTTAKYVIRFHPGSVYLPGVVPENATKPIGGCSIFASPRPEPTRSTRRWSRISTR